VASLAQLVDQHLVDRDQRIRGLKPIYSEIYG
jgi:hypothetical protein